MHVYHPSTLYILLLQVQLLVEKIQEARGMLSSRLNSSENLCLSQQSSPPPHYHHSHLPRHPLLEQVSSTSLHCYVKAIVYFLPF